MYASFAAALVGALLSFGALAQSEPIRVGFLTVRTGPLAAGGKQMEEGILLFLKERNYTPPTASASSSSTTSTA